MDHFHFIMEPLYTLVSFIMLAFHRFFTTIGLPNNGGVTWILSIIGLVLVVRTFLIPLYVKQIKAQRAMQLIQPEVKKIQQKYKHDRQLQSQKLMELYKERKANPFTSCLPLLAQSPFFFALFMVLKGISQNTPRGLIKEENIRQALDAHIFGAKLFDTFTQTESLSAKIVAALLIVTMTASTFFQQRQLIMKNMPESALTGSFAQQQKIMMYVMPLIFGLSGFVFPIGVLIYWLTTNLWSLGQQMVVIHRLPAPGSKAEKLYLERQAAKKDSAAHTSHSQSLLTRITSKFRNRSSSSVTPASEVPEPVDSQEQPESKDVPPSSTTLRRQPKKTPRKKRR
jgi:YidC/Oxa1 family membrane protein insertase